jgi:NO-binding membrane sensor protein with MHYT domain
MAILVFFIIAITGLFTTRTIFKTVLQKQKYSRKIGALTLAFGLGLTWFFSFIGPIAVVNKYQVEFGLFIFVNAVSLVVGIMTYFISLFILTYLEKNQK